MNKRIIEIINEVINQFDEVKQNKYKLNELGEYIYHQTSLSNAKEILLNGFKTGYELNKGERDSGIFFSPTYRGQENTNYSRGKSVNEKLVMIEVSTKNLNLFDTKTLIDDPKLMSFQQPKYIMISNIKQKNIFPENYDGVINRYNNLIYEIILKKEIANKNITGRLLNSRGTIVNI